MANGVSGCSNAQMPYPVPPVAHHNNVSTTVTRYHSGCVSPRSALTRTGAPTPSEGYVTSATSPFSDKSPNSRWYTAITAGSIRSQPITANAFLRFGGDWPRTSRRTQGRILQRVPRTLLARSPYLPKPPSPSRSEMRTLPSTTTLLKCQTARSSQRCPSTAVAPPRKPSTLSGT